MITAAEIEAIALPVGVSIRITESAHRHRGAIVVYLKSTVDHIGEWCDDTPEAITRTVTSLLKDLKT